MTSVASPPCLECRHYCAGLKCKAFPRRIPDDIIEGILVHDHPIPGDRGIQFEKIEPFSDLSSIKEDLILLLPEPCEIRDPDKNGLISITSGDPPQVTIRLTATEVQVYRPAYFWAGPHELVEDPRFVGSVDWRQPYSRNRYQELIDEARAQRKRTFRRCQYCGEMKPPEQRYRKDVCHSCAESHLRIVF